MPHSDRKDQSNSFIRILWVELIEIKKFGSKRPYEAVKCGTRSLISSKCAVRDGKSFYFTSMRLEFEFKKSSLSSKFECN